MYNVASAILSKKLNGCMSHTSIECDCAYGQVPPYIHVNVHVYC